MNANDRRVLAVGSTTESDDLEALAYAGYIVDTARSIDEAAQMLASTAYVLVCADPVTLASLREREEMYRSLVERSNDAIVVLQDYMIKFVNPQFEELSGYAAKRLVNTPFSDYLPLEETAVLLERYERRVAGEYVPPIYEIYMTRRGGRKIPLELSAAVVTFHGRPADLVLIRDITERKQAEEYLQKFRLLAENTSDILLFGTANGDIIEANRAAIEAYGYTREELLSMNARDLRVEEEREHFNGQLKQARRRPMRYETVHRRKDGITFPIEISVTAACVQNKSVLVGIGRDITERKRAQDALDSERRRLRSVLDALPVAVFIADSQGCLTEVNEQAQVIWGGPIPEVECVEQFDKCKAWSDDGESLGAYGWAICRAITKGETVLDEIVHIERFDGTHGTIVNSAAPILDAEGHITGAVAIQQDITELVNLREALESALDEAKREGWRASILEGIAEAGLSILMLPELLHDLVGRIARALEVDASCVFVLDEEAGEFEAYAAYNVPKLVGCRVKTNEGMIGRIAQERRPTYLNDADHDPLSLDACEQIGAKTMFGVPLMARGKVVGVARVQSLAEREFTEDEIRLMQAIADRAAMAIDNAKLYNALQHSSTDLEEALERERHFSLLLQQALLPARPGIGEDYVVATRYVPAYVGREIGGDFYDVFENASDWAGILIGDVAGKGLEAAALAATTRSTIHAFAHETPLPDEVLARTNSVIYTQEYKAESFVTVLLVCLRQSTGEICYSNAGHPMAVILRATGAVEFLSFGNLPLGVLALGSYEQHHDRLNPNDKLLLYTDGITEARDRLGQFDLEGIERLLAGHGEWNAEQVADELIRSATAWGGGKLRDDVAVVVVERRG